jgi:hypothetical protein
MLPLAFINEINSMNEKVVVFGVMRNENLRIRAWLRHYRAMGVRAFAIIDNGSTDGTAEYLSEQPDVVVTRLTDSFSSVAFGVHWLNEFHKRVTPLTWVLFADADEFLVYRDWPNVPVATFVQQAADEGCNAVFGFMLDMYPKGPLEEATLREDADPFAVAPCFDGEYYFRAPPRKPWAPPSVGIEVVGGPRMRMLSSYRREISTTWFSYFVRGQIDRFIPIVPERLLPLLVRLMPQQMPALSKAPLVLSGNGIEYENNHSVVGATFFRENCLFGHFKFLADFAERVRIEASRGEHYRRGAEYMRYANAIDREDRIDLTYGGSLKFEGSEHLVELGLIRDVSGLLARNSGRLAPVATQDRSKVRTVPAPADLGSPAARHPRSSRASKTAGKVM